MKLLFQPDTEDRLGDVIQSTLLDATYNEFHAAVAFAKRSGVQYLAEGLGSLTQRGGNINLIVGIDHFGTSYEALEQLLLMIGNHGELWVYHDERKHVTFHPKIYIFEGRKAALLIVGSGNLTQGGLFTNKEASLVYELNLESEEDLENLIAAKNLLNSWKTSDPSLAMKINLENLEELKQNGYIKNESELRMRVEDEAELLTSNTPNQEISTRSPRLFGRGSQRRLLPRTSTRRTARRPSITRPVSPSSSSSGGVTPHVEAQTPLEVELDTERKILVRFVPKAGDRTSQVHFTLEIARDYFRFGDDGNHEIRLQQHQPGQPLGAIEVRPLVLSTVNQNAKIEISGAARLRTDYPEIEEGRPILVFEQIDNDFFQYMLLMPGDEGHSNLSDYLNALPKRGNHLPFSIIEIRALLSVWPDYPVMA